MDNVADDDLLDARNWIWQKRHLHLLTLSIPQFTKMLFRKALAAMVMLKLSPWKVLIQVHRQIVLQNQNCRQPSCA